MAICKATFVHFGKDGKLRESPCGKCWACLVNKRKEWTFRAVQEAKNSYTSAFLTLTYADEFLTSTGELNDKGEEIYTLVKNDLKAFFHRFRTENKRYSKLVPIEQKYGFKSKKMTYYSIGEYGGQFGRPHYHALLFNYHPDLESVIQKKWDKGFVSFNRINGARINYVTSYVITNRKDLKDKENEFALISNGFGKDYVSTVLKMLEKEQELFVVNKGKRQAIPSYYKRIALTTPELKSKYNNQVKFEKSLSDMRSKQIDKCEKIGINPFVYQTETSKIDKQKFDTYNKKSRK